MGKIVGRKAPLTENQILYNLLRQDGTALFRVDVFNLIYRDLGLLLKLAANLSGEWSINFDTLKSFNYL